MKVAERLASLTSTGRREDRGTRDEKYWDCALTRARLDYLSSTQPETAALVYQALSQRRSGFDTLVWQTPALSLTAQAFLFTIALGNNGSGARLASSFLAMVVTFMSMQLMSKHRYHEIHDGEILRLMEIAYDWPSIHGPKGILDTFLSYSPKRYERMSAYSVWIRGLLVFGAVAAIILIRTAWSLISQV